MAAPEENQKMELLQQQLSANTQELKRTQSDVRGLENLMVTLNSTITKLVDAVNNTRSEPSGDKKEDGDANLPSISPAPMKRQPSLAWGTAVDLIQNQLNERVEKENEEIANLRANLLELQQETNNQSKKLQELGQERESWKSRAEIAVQKLRELGAGEELEKELAISFPANETVLHNLLVAQIEFYFSDHHLKRDKPLMQNLTQDPQGFISFDDVCTFPKIRTLGQDKEVVQTAILASKYLSVKMDEDKNLLYVGRDGFKAPRAQEFPFRRTVFVYGIDPVHNEDWIRDQFSCFGAIKKIKFDSGPHSSPRKVGAKLLKKEPSRVTRLHMFNHQHTRLKFMTQMPDEISGTQVGTQYICHKCNRLKEYKDGYYSIPVDEAYQNSEGAQRCCIQCAAKQAEENNKKYQKMRHNTVTENDAHVRYVHGIDDNDVSDVNSFSSCLIVYESQRQASKCVYVRSRLGIGGCYATHFHNYTRNKKELTNGEELEPSLMRPASSEFKLQALETNPPLKKNTSFHPQSSVKFNPNRFKGMRKAQSTPNRGTPSRGPSREFTPSRTPNRQKISRYAKFEEPGRLQRRPSNEQHQI